MTLRELNWAGPCIDVGTVVKQNDKWWWVDNGQSRLTRKSKTSIDGRYSLHTDPCARCMDHPNTNYPRGYES
jgi:hypothetical protein